VLYVLAGQPARRLDQADAEQDPADRVGPPTGGQDGPRDRVRDHEPVRAEVGRDVEQVAVASG